MPRLTNDRYHQRHLRLRQLWQQQQAHFSRLNAHQQWDLHAYYQPSRQLTETELYRHRQLISREQPSLPARASKAYKTLSTASPFAAATSTSYTNRNGTRQISVRAVVRPEIDVEKLARALLEVAKQLGARD